MDSLQVQLLAFGIAGGVALLVLVGISFSRFYKRCGADEALVRTGSGGTRVYIGEGAFVMPVLHQLMRVSLKSIKLSVERSGKHALVTADKIKANVTTELYVKVEPIEDSVRAAARSFGSANLEPHVVAELIEGKLTDALRSAAANKTFMDLHKDRQGFADRIKQTLVDELKQNGLILENVSITALAMLPVDQLDPNDVFDAEGMRAITETVQANLEKTNRIKREKENEILAQNVAARQRALELEQAQKQSEADQARRVAEYSATQQAETAKAVYIQQQSQEMAAFEKNRAVELSRIVQERDVQQTDLERQGQIAVAEAARKRAEKEAQIATEKALQAAEIAKQREIEAANIEKQKVVQAAEIDRQKAVQEAEVAKQKVIEAATIEKEQAVETAKIAKQIAVTKTEEEAARAAAGRARAEAEQEEAMQAIVTVEETARANREKAIATIKAEEEAQKSRIAAEREAYKLRLEAETAAAAKKAAAEGEVARAKGAADAAKLEAEARAAALTAAAEAQAAATRTEAGAEADRLRITAEARAASAAQEAQATITLAEATRKKGEAEAEARRLLVEAENAVAAKFMLRDLGMKALEAMPAVTRELMAPAQAISEIKVLNLQGGAITPGSNGEQAALGASTPILKTIMEAGAAYPLLRELMNFAQVDSGAIADKARAFLTQLPGEVRTAFEQDPSVAGKLEELQRAVRAELGREPAAPPLGAEAFTVQAAPASPASAMKAPVKDGSHG